MDEKTNTQLAKKLSESPILRARELPSVAEIDDASRELGVPFSSDYREFLVTYGGAMVGPYPVYGLRPVDVMDDESWSVVMVTKAYRNEEIPAVQNWVVFSTDHAGNPIGMDHDGTVWIHDHDFGGVAPLAKNFEEYIRVRCLGIGAG